MASLTINPTYNRCLIGQGKTDAAVPFFLFSLAALPAVQEVTAAKAYIYVNTYSDQLPPYTGGGASYSCEYDNTWDESSNATTLGTVASNLSSKSFPSTVTLSSTGWKEFDVLGTTGSSGYGVKRAVELSRASVTFMPFFGLPATNPLAADEFLYLSYVLSSANDPACIISPRTDSTYKPYLEITYTPATNIAAFVNYYMNMMNG